MKFVYQARNFYVCVPADLKIIYLFNSKLIYGPSGGLVVTEAQIVSHRTAKS